MGNVEEYHSWNAPSSPETCDVAHILRQALSWALEPGVALSKPRRSPATVSVGAVDNDRRTAGEGVSVALRRRRRAPQSLALGTMGVGDTSRGLTGGSTRRRRWSLRTTNPRTNACKAATAAQTYDGFEEGGSFGDGSARTSNTDVF